MLISKRLKLRLWTEDDFEAFAKINADPLVMECFPSTMTREESDALALSIMEEFELRGYGLWAVEVLNEAPFTGFVGLHYADFINSVEIGWRLDRAHWGKGYATEAALMVRDDAFGRLQLKEIVSFTAVQNTRSQKVMERIGMTHDPKDDFDHPKLPEGHPLKRHVLYRLQNL